MIRQSVGALGKPPTTVTTFNHFKILAETCNKKAYDQSLTPIYITASHSSNGEIAELGFYMRALAAYRNKENTEALQYLKEVLRRDPEAPEPRRLFNKLKKSGS